MSIVSPMLLAFLLPVTLLLFYALGRRGGEKPALLVLLLASLVFAQSQGWSFFALFLGSLVLNAWLVQRLAAARAGRKAFVLGVLANLAALGIFKYANLLKLVPGGGEYALLLGSLIPVTISFLTFQRIAALADAKANAEHLQGGAGTLRFAGFASFFPSLLIGPIAYLQEVLPQFRRSDFGKPRAINFAVGLTLVSIGLFKKAVLADGIGAAFVDPAWKNIGAGFAISWFDAVAASLGYMLQLYFDFSGYSDMAIGIARLFGIILPINFYSPFRATSLADFWRRWHITLTRIVARFLFTPLSLAGTRLAARRGWRGTPMSALALWLPLLANFSIIGLWHGAKPTFLLFGLLHGAWYAGEATLAGNKRWKKRMKTLPDSLRRWAGRAILLPFLALTFSLFRAPDLSAFELFAQSLASIGKMYWLTIEPDLMAVALFGFAVLTVLALPNSQELLGRYRPGLVTYRVDSHTPAPFAWRWRPTIGWSLAIATLAAFALWHLPRATIFSYEVF